MASALRKQLSPSSIPTVLYWKTANTPRRKKDFLDWENRSGRVLTTRFVRRAETVRILGSGDGENFVCSMAKQTKQNSLKLNRKETNAIRRLARKSGSVKITINIDAETLKKVRTLSDNSGVPYQRLINKILGDSLLQSEKTEDRLV